MGLAESKIALSYIICTRNRLPFLKITLQKLMDSISNDEEIVVVDANSTDGTQAYLTALFEEGKIHQYISEADRNQAHGWNKALLMAKGVILKKIIDDDVFDYESIRKCANYLIENPKVDVLISNDLSAKLIHSSVVTKNSRLQQFKNWSAGNVPSFTFGDVHMLIRKSALPLIGLYNTSFVMIDWEYSLRISYLKANIAYYTGYNALSVYQEQSVSGQKKQIEIDDQEQKAKFFYAYAGDTSDLTLWSKFKIAVGKRIFSEKKVSENAVPENISQIYDQLYHQIKQLNKEENYTFFDTEH